ncbi:uncharacterized [Tachysurus ichikawai]
MLMVCFQADEQFELWGGKSFVLTRSSPRLGVETPVHTVEALMHFIMTHKNNLLFFIVTPERRSCVEKWVCAEYIHLLTGPRVIFTTLHQLQLI